MSAIAGILYGDKRPVPDRDLAIFAAHSRPSGPDGGGTFTAPGIAILAYILRFDRLSASEQQPYRCANGSVLTWDGRLDNRDDLLIALHRHLGEDISDVAIVAAAYEHWGLDCFPLLLGDWSLAIWDSTNRSLVLARDYMGNRPLYYVGADSCFAWATCLNSLLERFDLFSQPNEAYIAGQLTFGVPSEMTPFRSAMMLRAGHHLVIRSGCQPEIRRYWFYQPNNVRYRRHDEYTDHLRALLTEAVRVRLRSDRTVWSHLSGGWDSSSVVCLAHSLIRRGRVDAPRLQPVSTVCTDSPESDESAFIGAVERWCGLSTVRHEVRELPLLATLRGQQRPNPYLADWAMEGRVQAAGDRVILSGELGDAVMLQNSGDFIGLLEPLHAGHPLQCLRLCFAFARHRQDPVWPLLRRLARTYLPTAIRTRNAHRRLLAHRARQRHLPVGDLAKLFGVPRDFLAQAPMREPEAVPSTAGLPHVKRRLVENLYRAADGGALSNSDLLVDVRATYPYTHRPLVLFILSTPQLAFWDPVGYRVGMRHALQDILPPEILTRTSKGNPAALNARQARPVGHELTDDVKSWQLVQRGYVDATSLTQAIVQLKQGSADTLGFVLQCGTIEMWLQSLPLPPTASPSDGQLSVSPRIGPMKNLARPRTPRGAHASPELTGRHP